MTYWVYIIESADRIEIRRYLRMLEAAAEDGAVLYWNRDGYVKVWSNAALRNAVSRYYDANALQIPETRQAVDPVRNIVWSDLIPSETLNAPIPIELSYPPHPQGMQTHIPLTPAVASAPMLEGVRNVLPDSLQPGPIEIGSTLAMPPQSGPQSGS